MIEFVPTMHANLQMHGKHFKHALEKSVSTWICVNSVIGSHAKVTSTRQIETNKKQLWLQKRFQVETPRGPGLPKPSMKKSKYISVRQCFA